MKIAILTMFSGLDSTYSLVSVVAEQLRMLLDANHQVKLIVNEHFDDKGKFGVYLDERIEWVKILNTLDGKQIQWYDYSMPYGVVHDSFHEEAEAIAADFVQNMMDVRVCIMHDILYQGWHLLHNIAIRKAQIKLSHIKFISFSHSAPVNRPTKLEYPFSARYTPMKNTIYISFTYSAIPAITKQYGIPEGRCSIIYNSLDLLANLNEEVRAISQKVDLFSPDILIVYPGRLTPGKRFEKVAALAGAIKKRTEKKVKIVFCDFPSGDIESGEYKRLIINEGVQYGLDDSDISFTSDLGFPSGFPRKAVLDLFTLSNLFICPSYSEAFPLTVLEAASRGNLIILNQAVPSLDEIGKSIGAYFLRWDARNYGFDSTESYVPSEQLYYEEHGEKVVDILRENPVIKAKSLVRQRYSPQWIWINQFQPLLDTNTDDFAEKCEYSGKELIKKRLYQHQITSAQIDPFSYCNSRCWYCPVRYIPNPAQAVKQMPIELFRKILVDLDEEKKKEHGIVHKDFQFIYTGHYNEILLYRHFKEMLDLLREFHIKTMILSNGVPLTREKSELIKDYQDVVIGICLNIPAFEDELWAKRTGMSRNLFPRLVDNIHYCMEKLPDMVTSKEISIQINGATCYSFDEYGGWLTKGPIFPSDMNLDADNGELQNQSKLAGQLFPGMTIYTVPSLIDRAGLLDRIGVMSNKSAILKNLKKDHLHVTGCHNGFENGGRTFGWLHVNSIGQVFLCCDDYNFDYVFGDYRTQMLKDFWYSDLHMEIIDKALNKICRDCASSEWG